MHCPRFLILLSPMLVASCSPSATRGSWAAHSATDCYWSSQSLLYPTVQTAIVLDGGSYLILGKPQKGLDSSHGSRAWIIDEGVLQEGAWRSLHADSVEVSWSNPLSSGNLALVTTEAGMAGSATLDTDVLQEVRPGEFKQVSHTWAVQGQRLPCDRVHLVPLRR